MDVRAERRPGHAAGGPFCQLPAANCEPTRACHTRRMREALVDVGRKGLALLILLAAAWILFKLVLGVVAAVAWVVVVVVAAIAVVWALRQL
jgi:hypothetical protein